MIVYKHIRKTNNIGDRWCSPYDHIQGLQENSVALDLDDPTPAGAAAVVFGGGKIMGSLKSKLTATDMAAPIRVAWGVSTIQSFPISPRYWRAFRAMTLVGSRDWGDKRFDFVPCASCGASVFDEDRAETDDVVAYLHHWRAPEMGIEVPADIPVLENTVASFEEAVRFIARGRTVVSNSYHGIYWALLLGKRVLCLPFSNKFNKFRVAPGYSTAQHWQRDLAKARGSDEMLGLCRDATGRFKAKVENIIAL